MKVTTHVQYTIPNAKNFPSKLDFKLWVKTTLADHLKNTQVTIRIVHAQEMEDLNWRYRGKKGTTNILSFPISDTLSIASYKIPLGDLIICAPVVAREALEQNKDEKAHWAHLTIHGVLHLLGFDHQYEDEAQYMEAKEIAILEQLGYSHPYEINSE
ncbi:rRNA maturation RNase YbeY [Candidatus Nitrosacidococcus tergens]|uniref:Endoribonuclease YbeY n=1 Tax=Candidatus Nitrosacidococcus tergens TaxID=553981 RepID=A0A7G1Q797_9GAMM|nr:rRNA maturation RNase YbeY [Candidatus Nitrosacidococcus tergens]CAB1274211.1 putative metal-dependent hydrolase [Candidatus Nitrosacidococcus tergens]